MENPTKKTDREDDRVHCPHTTTYYKENEADEDTYKATVTHVSPPIILVITFRLIFICYCPTPATLENRCIRWVKNPQPTPPAWCLMILANHCYQMLLVKVRVNHVFAFVFPDKKERIVQLNQTQEMKLSHILIASPNTKLATPRLLDVD